jgi:hypothetical protein
MTKLVYVKFVSASAPCTHARTSEKNLIILQCNTEHKKVFLHIPGLKNTQIKIPRNVVDDVGTCIFVNMAFNLTLSLASVISRRIVYADYTKKGSSSYERIKNVKVHRIMNK